MRERHIPQCVSNGAEALKKMKYFSIYDTRVEASLRVVKGDKREPSARGYNWANLFLGDTNTGTWPSRLGESQMRQ
jgi:hypothetical protein